MAGGGKVTRVHGPFVEDNEVEKVTKFLWLLFCQLPQDLVFL